MNLAFDKSARTSQAVLAAIALALLFQAWVALVTEINWDEFYYLSQIYDYQRGELTRPLQTAHVHLFGWLPAIDGDEIRQIVVGRLVMLLCEAATCVLIYRLSRAFFEPLPSLFAVLGFVSAGFTMIHGASFRADPLAGMLTMAALVTLARRRPGAASIFLIAFASALAALVNVKVVFYAPAFAGIAAWRIANAENRGLMVRSIVATAFATMIALGALYWLQSLLMPKATTAATQAMLSGAGRTTIVDAGLSPRFDEIVRSALGAPAQTIILILGMWIAVQSLLANRRRHAAQAWALLGCAAPLLSLLFYRNAFPYFFPFIWPPAMPLVALAIENLLRMGQARIILALVMTATGLLVGGRWAELRPRITQEKLVSAVHRMFPRPVPYIDRNGVIASFPKRGFFMSTWGMAGYQQRGVPVFERMLVRETIPLVIIDGPALEHAASQFPGPPTAPTLLDQDRKTLRDNYIPHWGAIWVAGQRLSVGPAETEVRILIPGTYTLEGGSMTIDGKAVPPGSTVILGRGDHRLWSRTAVTVTLRWGDHLYRPTEAAPTGPVYRGF